MNLFSYIVMHDSGFAPNPFHGFCTLACCKPRIRQAAQVGDLVVGLSPKSQGNRVIYIMKVTDKLSFEEYWRDERFREKRPVCRNKPACPQTPPLKDTPDGPEDEALVGDSIYEPLPDGRFLQHCGCHSECHMDTDLGQWWEGTGSPDEPLRNVLVSDRFVYFGARPVALSPPFDQPRQHGGPGLIVTRGNTRVSSDEGTAVRQFEDCFEALLKAGKSGRLAKPGQWPPQI